MPSSSSHLRQKFPSSLTYYSISSVPFTALDIQHFLKPFTFASVRYAVIPLQSTLTTYYILYFLVFKCNFIPCRFTVFSTDGVKNLNTCVMDFVSCLWADKSEFMALFRFLLCGLVQVLFWSLVVNFSIYTFHLLPLD